LGIIGAGLRIVSGGLVSGRAGPENVRGGLVSGDAGLSIVRGGLVSGDAGLSIVRGGLVSGDAGLRNVSGRLVSGDAGLRNVSGRLVSGRIGAVSGRAGRALVLTPARMMTCPWQTGPITKPALKTMTRFKIVFITQPRLIILYYIL
jgi:hypothetical protein